MEREVAGSNPVVHPKDVRSSVVERQNTVRQYRASLGLTQRRLEGTQNTPSRDEVYELIVGLLKDAVMQYGPSVSEVEAEAYATSRFVHNGNLRDFLALFNAPQPAQPVTEKPK